MRARPPAVDSLGSLVPVLDVAIDPISSFLTAMAVLVTAVITIDRVTCGWTRRRAAAIAGLAVVGFLTGGMPAGSHTAGWAIAGALMSVALVSAYVTLLRFDPTLVPLALGTMAAVRALGLVVHGAFPGAAAGGLLAAVVASALAWWWFRLLRRMV